ncbi:citrate synthase [Actinophytocola oryzae]|uniref:citrate synthase (unknown stereospecificity) n=1 Tax=Actinophytocola oryzae TaxID=502181 RepID=A0A4R7W630_9PSEU|nr:citrate synthase [Actinophytocola oryzae]TDV57735.1 citrate synthase [Actinophytocola oryzae]
MTEDTGVWLTADEAADRLNVKKETVYAYVSRGRLTSRKAAGGRGSLFRLADIDRLSAKVRRGKENVPPDGVESEITLITPEALFYRSRKATDLAESATFEEVARLLWGFDTAGTPWLSSPATERFCRKVIKTLPASALPVDQVKVIAACIAAVEPPTWDVSPDVVATTAQRTLATMLTALPAKSEPVDTTTFDAPASPMAALLWSRLCDRAPNEAELKLLNAAMVMLADHDLAAATHVVRTAARAGVEPSGLLRLGIDVGSGPVKGSASLAIESLLHNMKSAATVEESLGMRLRQGAAIPGFGHQVYPTGDVRAAYLLARLRRCSPQSDRLATVENVIKTQEWRGLPAPNAGFALAAMTYVLGMAPGSGETIFVLSRAAGWVAHAIEAYRSGPMERIYSVNVHIGD